MPGLRDIQQSVKLEDNGTFVGLYDPTKDVVPTEHETYGTRYTFHLLARNGRLMEITGGSRLLDEFIRVASDKEGKPVDDAVWVEITAHGKPGDMKRDYSIRPVPKP